MLNLTFDLAGSTKYFYPVVPDDLPPAARQDMHRDGKTVALLSDPSGIYRPGARFTWWDLVYTQFQHYWAEGTLFRLTPARGGAERLLEVRDGALTDVLTGERLLLRPGGHQWEYAPIDRLWELLKWEEE